VSGRRGRPGPRTPNPRIKSLSAANSQGFIGVRAAAQPGSACPAELGRTAVNCNPNCNPRLDDHLTTRRLRYGTCGALLVTAVCACSRPDMACRLATVGTPKPPAPCCGPRPLVRASSGLRLLPLNSSHQLAFRTSFLSCACAFRQNSPIEFDRICVLTRCLQVGLNSSQLRPVVIRIFQHNEANYVRNNSLTLHSS